MAKTARARSRKTKPLRSAASARGRDLARSVRKPIAPPARVEKPAKSYERRRAKRVIEEGMEESR